MLFFEYDTEKAFDFENGFYLTSDVSRIAKIIAHYEIYKMVKDISGDIFEFGVFKGVSLIKWATYRKIFAQCDDKAIIGFDVFDKFPNTIYEEDKILRENFVDIAGDMSISVKELKEIIHYKQFHNIELIKGDIIQTVPDYIINNKDIKIALLHIDVDLYEPSIVILDNLYDKVVSGGVVLLDDYGFFHGETKAVDEYFADKNVEIKTFPYSKTKPAYIIKS